jgi:hypothetical protein
MQRKIWLIAISLTLGSLLATLIGCSEASTDILTLQNVAFRSLVSPAGARQPLDPGVADETGSIKVELEKTDAGWRLLRNGKPYEIRGAGGAINEGSMKKLAEFGGNSTRTWGVDDNTPALLDAAQKNGLTVVTGIWLEHERLGMDYTNFDDVMRQIELTMSHVKRLKNHPAILVWGIGNEMEGEQGDNPAIWSHIEYLAQLIKAEDPNHPVMTVIAEMGGRKIEAIHKLCPSIDIVGINSYGGAPSLPERYRQLGGTKPYIITEFGPMGTWEVGKNSIDAIDEPTSTAKAEHYRTSFEAFKNDTQHCLGAYAFLWGNKQEGTETWFGMLTPDGKKTAAVDVMSEFWTGKPPANSSPRIESLTLEGPSQVGENATVKVNLKADDPEGQPVHVLWRVREEAASYVTSGDFQETPAALKDAIVKSDGTGAVVKLPETSGVYRIYAFVDDGHDAAATANVSVRVQGKLVLTENSPKASLPLVVYDEPDMESKFISSGFMGSTEAIKLDPKSTDAPKVGTHCLKCEFTKAADWGGVVWQHPENDWGDLPGGVDLRGATKLTFWVRGKNGGEKIKFGFGVLGQDKKYFDTAKKEIEITLTTEWTQHTIDLTGLDLQRIKTGFFWSLAGQGQPITFFLDRIAFD